jgi:hypothetical protein
MLQKRFIDDATLPVTIYNYSGIRDRLANRGIVVALSTVIDRARSLDSYQPQPSKKVHDCEVITTTTGAFIQQNGSHHRSSPYAKEKWILITSPDDFSHMLLYADLFEQETSSAHMKASEALIEAYETPFCYYVDSLRVFRFV